MRRPSETVVHDPYTDPPLTNAAGYIVLYRMKGDIWNVAGTPQDVEWLESLGRFERIAKGVEAMLVREAT